VIFARVDVELRDHPRARRAGVAMTTWTYALLYSRRHELDGFVPDDALRGGWVPEPVGREHASVLVDVGLWGLVDGGWEIINYANKNETRAAIETRRQIEREKKQRWRERRESTQRSTHASTDRSPGVSPVDTGSSGGSLREEDQSQSQSQSQSQDGTVPSLVDTSTNGVAMPPWYPAVVEMVSANTGAKIDLAASWLRYSGHRRSKGKPFSSHDAQQWLVTVDVKEAREARERTSSRGSDPRNIKQRAEDADAPWRAGA